ncbi:MAG: shikimate kinase [Flexilinea sp.]
MFGLIGEKLGHSYSKSIHQLLSDGAYLYELFAVPPQEFESFLNTRSFDGLNVTIPYKKTIIPYLADISNEAKKIGSVNTVLVRLDGLYGYNTDYAGFLYMAKRAGIDFCGKKVLILGTGGTGATASAAVNDQGAHEVIIASRRGKVTYDRLSEYRNSQIIINTTPVGMYPKNGETLIDLSDFPCCEGVLDVIYNPLYTVLTLQAKDLGIPFGNGLAMLTAQAKYASDLFLDRVTDDDKIEAVLDTMIRQTRNIVLVGMPGCGKSTIGKLIAGLTGKDFVDIDEEIIRRTGKEITRIFNEDGENTFRNLESRIIFEKGKENGQVIATGGGAVLREDNRTALRQNGRIIFLRCDLSVLSMNDRPLSVSPDALISMYDFRLPIYEKCSDYWVDNNDSIEETVRMVMRKIEEK